MNIRKHLFFSPLFYYALSIDVFLLILGQLYPLFFMLGMLFVGVLLMAVLLDVTLLFMGNKAGVIGYRHLEERFSNGDDNEVILNLENEYSFSISLKVLEEVPFQFQLRNVSFKLKLKPQSFTKQTYLLKPVSRGEYWFGVINVLVNSPLRLVTRRFRLGKEQMVKVYPSFKQMRKFEMMAISNRLSEVGVKKIRRIGHQMEFDQIRDYAKGDDYRTINWKATARRDHLMVNQYQDERSQQVISVIDLGRTMKMPFGGMTLLDYAINTSLVLSNIAMLKQDKAGLVTFNNQVRTIVPPLRNTRHMQVIMDHLYNQQTQFEEHSMHNLYAALRRRINHRSLLVLYTNFESMVSAQRQIPMLQKLARDHMVVVVFFENIELTQMTHEHSEDMEGIYIKTIAEKMVYDKRLVARELNRLGIHSVLTEPGKLTVDTINKYLELKARGVI